MARQLRLDGISVTITFPEHNQKNVSRGFLPACVWNPFSNTNGQFLQAQVFTSAACTTAVSLVKDKNDFRFVQPPPSRPFVAKTSFAKDKQGTPLDLMTDYWLRVRVTTDKSLATWEDEHIVAFQTESQ